MKISAAELKVVRFANEDVIATSFFLVSKEDYEAAGGNTDFDYVGYQGKMGYYSDDAEGWAVFSNGGSVIGFSADEVAQIRAGQSGNPYNTYGTYVYDNGDYIAIYTKGASYDELLNQ